MISIRDPVTQKRLKRFRRRKTAVVSLWILLSLFALSLVSELLCNDRPLYIRLHGRSYFPVLKYYPDDIFTGSGLHTRPDYREIRDSAAFRKNSDNFMLFPPIPFGPYESANPEALAAEVGAVLALTPAPRVGSIDIHEDLTVARSMAAEPFLGDKSVTGLSLPDHWDLPETLLAAVRERFRNQEAPSTTVLIESKDETGCRAEASLSPFRTRRVPPRTVRITLRDPTTSIAKHAEIRFTPDGHLPKRLPPLWESIDADIRTSLLKMIQSTALPGAMTFDIGGVAYRASAARESVAWPFRPVRGHWLGIDSAGRDVLARVLYGLRISMIFGFLLVALSLLMGIVIGAIQGYYGGRVDITAQRLVEIWSALPFLYVMILMGSIYGRSFGLLLGCYAVFNWIGISYYIRAEFLRLRKQPFVDAAKCMGIPDRKIMWRHILPNALTPVITFLPFYLVGAIGSLAALDFLGFGLPPPTPSWGELLHQAQQFRWAWWLILYPSLTLFVVMLLGVFIGEGVRDAYDPRPFSRME